MKSKRNIYLKFKFYFVFNKILVILTISNGNYYNDYPASRDIINKREITL